MKRQSTTSSRRPEGEERSRPMLKAPAAPRQRRKAISATRGDSGTRITPEERWQMIATAAYYRAAQRGFAPGRELEDWVAAEAEIRHLVGE